MSGRKGGEISANLRWKEEWEKQGKMVGQKQEEMGGIGRRQEVLVGYGRYWEISGIERWKVVGYGRDWDIEGTRRWKGLGD